MICDNTEDALALAMEHAQEVGLFDNLKDKLLYLSDMQWFGRDCRVQLFKDFSPFSFLWSAQYWDGKEWQDAMNGGLLYYNRGDSGVSSPQFSVRMDTAAAGWEIHT